MSTRLRGNAPRRSGPYPLGQIPREVIVAVGRLIVHRLAVGLADIEGNDFGKIFASAIQGTHRGKPLGIADVGYESCAWSVKTIYAPKPATIKTVRLISGRNSPVYSHGINEPLSDLQKTGAAVLEIWNERVNEAFANDYDDLRIVVLVRNIANLEFLLMEYEAHRYNPADYVWELKSGRNLVGRDGNGIHRFTWQSHGSQFTILHEIPPSARRFRIMRQPPVLNENTLLKSIGFEESWIQTF